MSEPNPDSRDVGLAPADTARHLDPTRMRQLAEVEAAAMAAQELESLSPEEIRQILHELRVHQIQVEMQNDELRRSETQLDAVRARYFELYDLAPVGYCTVSEAGLILEGNLTAAKLLGATRSELVGQPIFDLIFREDKDVYYHHRRQLWETRQLQACELRMLPRNGSPFWVQIEATVAEDHGADAVCRVVLSDINERKRIEQSLSESEAKYRAIFENMVAACCMDEVIYQDGRAVDYRLLDVNPAFELITGIPRSRAVGALASALYGMGQEPFLDVYSKVAETGEPESFEAYFAPVQKHLFVTVGSPGPGKFSMVFSDVTEIVRAQEALRDSEARFRLLVESSPDAIFVQTERRFAYLNEAVVRLFGAETADDLLGQPVLDRFHPDVRDNVLERIRQLDELKLPVARMEEVCLRMDGTSVPVEVSAGPIHFQGSDGAWVFVRDVTARKQAEAKLAEQVADLQRWHDVTLGREGRVMELKKEVNELLSQAGQPPRYRSVLDEPVGSV